MDKINRECLLCWILEVKHQGGGTSDPAKLEAECGYKPHWSLHFALGLQPLAKELIVSRICVRPTATWQLVALVAMVPFRGDRSP